MDLFEEFRELIAHLGAANLDYAVAGALAVAVYGAPRATTDIDLVVRERDLAAIKEVAKALGFGVEALPMTFETGLTVHRLTKLGDGDSLQLDLMLADGPIAESFERREARATEFGDLWVVSLDTLIAMKSLAGRPRDLDDIRRLKEQDA